MMNRIILTGFLLTFFTVSIFAQHTENRSVSGYDKISICCGIDLYLSEGAETDLKIEVNNQSLLSAITTEVRGGELVISYDDKKFKKPNNSKMKIYTSARNLTAIKATSGSDVMSQTSLRADDIKLTATSGASIKLELTAKNINCSTSSGSSITLNGQAESATLNASSGSSLNLDKMKTESVNAQASSGSSIKVHAIKSINGEASSGAVIKYSGNPEKVDKRQSSGGSVKKN